MVIRAFWYRNLTNDFAIENIKFQNKKSLLVGNSGAGKTQILQAINNACKLAVGRLNHISAAFEMGMEFEIEKKDETWNCVWEIHVDYIPQISKKTEEPNLIIKKERLQVNGREILLRDDLDIRVLEYNSVPQPKESESLISQYRKEDTIQQIYLEFKNVFLRSFEIDMLELTSTDIYEQVCNLYVKENISPMLCIDELGMTPFDHYGIIKKVSPDIYQKISAEILEVYQDVFPEVEDISYLPDELKRYGIAIKANGQWIGQAEISSGMLKTLWNLINLKLLPRNAVVLIDELENGLGVNCIENVSDFIMNDRQDIQILATSHHPYIINAISMNHWIIIQRKQNMVKSYTAEELSLGQSKHDAYLQLVNCLRD